MGDFSVHVSAYFIFRCFIFHITTIGKIIGGGMPVGVIGISKNVYRSIEKKKI